MRSRNPDGTGHKMAHDIISRRRFLAAGGVVAVGGVSGCLSRIASRVTNTSASPAAVFAGEGASVGEPQVSRLAPTVSVGSGLRSGDVELEAWVTAVAANYNNTRSNRSSLRGPTDADSDGDGVDDVDDGVRVTALELEQTLLSQTTAAADAISKRSARTGRSSLADMSDTIGELQATVANCSDGVCVAVRENADRREKLVQRAQDHVESSEWDDAAAVVDEVRDIVEVGIDRLESDDDTSPIYEGDAVDGENILHKSHLALPGGDPLSDEEREALGTYLSDSPMVGERFTVCLPDAEVPGGNGSLAEEVTPQRFIDYITGRAADSEGQIYAWGRADRVAGNGGGDCDDEDEDIHPGDVCGTTEHFLAVISGPTATGGGLMSLRAGGGGTVTLTVVNSPPTVAKADTGPSVLVCPVDGESYEPADLSEWGSESGSSSETPTTVCQVMVQPPECPVPVRALLYAKRCRSDDQLVYTGGWVLDTAGLYEKSATALTLTGETQVIGVDVGVFDGDGDGYGDVVSRALSSDRARRGGQVETGSITSLVEAGVIHDAHSGEVYCWGSGASSKSDSGGCGVNDGADRDVVVTHCPLDASVVHLVNAGSASTDVKFKAGAELSKSVN